MRAITHPVGAIVPDNDVAGVIDRIQVGSEYANFSVEHVEVEFTAEHARRGDLEVTLTSPTGVVSHLGTVRPNDGGADFLAWRFRSVRHWGESAAGTWTLKVADRATGQVGIFSGWTLRVFGTGSTPVVSGGGGGGPVAGPVGGPAAEPVRPSAPEAPMSLSGVVTGTTLTLTWRAPATGSQPTSYAIEGGVASGASNLLSARTNGPATSYVASGLAPGTYFVRVRASNAFGTSVASNEIQVTVAAPATTPDAPVPTTTALGPSLSPFTSTTPATPSALSSAAFSAANEASTSLAASSIGIYGGAPTPMSAVPQSERPETSETNPNGEGGTPGAPGGTPVAAGGSTPAPEPMPAPEPEPIAGPGAPSDLVATASGSNLVLRWKSSYSGTRATTYVVEAGSESGGTNLFVTTVEGGKLTYTVKDADAGTYFVRVRASNGAGTSEPSNEATVSVGDATACTAPPSVPEGLKATVNGSSMVWSWGAAKGGVTSYILETASGPEGKNRVISNTGNAKTAFTVDDVMSGAYSARVRARNACGSGAFSDTVVLTIR